MIINKILNNNVAVVLDEVYNEKIIMGKGICFSKKVGDVVDESVVEKEFLLLDETIRKNFVSVASNTSLECVYISERIISKAKKQLGRVLNDNIFVSLTDHLQFAIDRYKKGISLKSNIMWEIKSLYPEEYKLGEEAVDLINKKFQVTLPKDEVAFITLHIVSADINEPVSDVVNITKAAQDIIGIIQHFFKVEINESSLAYERFLTHLKFFSKRIITNTTYADTSDQDLFKVITQNYFQPYLCAKKIGIYIDKALNKKINDEELMYLTIHIQRIIFLK